MQTALLRGCLPQQHTQIDIRDLKQSQHFLYIHYHLSMICSNRNCKAVKLYVVAILIFFVHLALMLIFIVIFLICEDITVLLHNAPVLRVLCKSIELWCFLCIWDWGISCTSPSRALPVPHAQEQSATLQACMCTCPFCCILFYHRPSTHSFSTPQSCSENTKMPWCMNPDGSLLVV